jgi:hypothetical protein
MHRYAQWGTEGEKADSLNSDEQYQTPDPIFTEYPWYEQNSDSRG